MWTLLLSIITFTVQSNKKVTMTTPEDVPLGVSASYICSYQKGQITAGDSAVLYVTGAEDMMVSAVQLTMKSNQKTGAGTLTVTADGQTVWNIPNASFDAKDWNGAYSTDYVSIGHTFTPVISSDRWKIRIDATKSSLYVQDFQITYTLAQPKPHEVQFAVNVGTPIAAITETTAGEGIILPKVECADEEWHFVGWTEQTYEQADEAPSYFAAGTRYYPLRNVTLIALYANQEALGLLPADSLAEGYYLITIPVLQVMMRGDANNGSCAVEAVKMEKYRLSSGDSSYRCVYPTIYEDNLYKLSRPNDSVVTIQNYATKQYVGYSNSHQLMQKESPWMIRQYADRSVLFYMKQAGKPYALRANNYGDGVACQPVPNMETWTFAPLMLYRVDDTERQSPIWTSFPNPLLPVEAVFEDSQSKYKDNVIEVNIGVYQLHIQGDKKYLHIK